LERKFRVREKKQEDMNRDLDEKLNKKDTYSSSDDSDEVIYDDNSFFTSGLESKDKYIHIC